MPLNDLLILALAALRLYYLFAHENGPFNIFVRLRLLVGVIPWNQAPGYLTTNNFAYGLMCASCATLWYGIILTIGYTLYPIYTIPIAFALALSLLAVFIMNVQARISR